VDYATDGLIQTTIRTAPAFRGCTLVVIAHRINTILDSDAVLVFHDGRCVEQGPPQELLAAGEPASRFAAMVREAEGGGKKGGSPGVNKSSSSSSFVSTLPFLVSDGGDPASN
jgi:ABC-type transport system involved in cytochrome bd biosynthesis fused ATPase/permease subunit